MSDRQLEARWAATRPRRVPEDEGFYADRAPVIPIRPNINPCHAVTIGVLCFDRPTIVHCGLAEGHDGWHRMEMTWGDEVGASAANAA